MEEMVETNEMINAVLLSQPHGRGTPWQKFPMKRRKAERASAGVKLFFR